MYPSVIAIPFAMLSTGALKWALGPLKTRDLTHRAAAVLRAIRPPRRIAIEPDDMKFELRFIEKCKCPPRIACFEASCALTLWLAAHGQTAKVCIGKRLENGHLLMHAWVESDSNPFFYDGRFCKIWDTDAHA
ncbi:MAG: lasso peptide biosynthesis protein [Proteobacteria bacterium]|nr:lasso peptide biosynthesis protein [Pseudomonadota bacterium]